MVEQPAGVVTLVFTDIEGSTRLLHELGQDAYREALGEHRRIVREAFARHGGYEVDYEGDAFFYAFASAREAVLAVADAQAGLAAGPIKVRVGVHTGTPGLDPPKYVGADVHLAARVMSAGHGGQVLLTGATRAVLEPSNRLLLSELGEHRLKDIEVAVPLFQLGNAGFPPLKTISNTNLPRPASSFVGREREVAEVVELLREARLVTLTGPGGTGKTRLSIEAAAELVGELKAGLFWVGLAALRDPALVMETIAETLGATRDLAEHVGEREMLLLLDNFEQVVDAAPELSAVLRACPNLRLLVTSRELLRIDGEAHYPVPPLAAREAAELFCARSGLEASDEIRELCGRLDDMPLAVELAAARTTVLTPGQILDRLGQRLDLLKGGRDADPRQLTLRATIEWSYELLTPGEQELLACLGVFAGGCTLEAAEHVAGADVETLQSLVERSLVRRADERFWMLETIREFARERLDAEGRLDELQARHGEWFADQAELSRDGLRNARPEVTARAVSDHANYQAALGWAGELGRASVVFRIVGGMWAFWIFRSGYKEGQRWARWIADRRPEVPSGLHLEGLIGASELLRWGGELDEAADLTRYTLPTLRALEEHALVAALLTSLAEIRSIQGRTDEGRELALEALEIRRRVGDPEGLASTLGALGLVEFYAEDFVAARTLFEEALGVWGKSSLYDVAEIRLRLGMCSARLGDPAGARDHLRAAFALALQQHYVFPEAFEELASVCASTHPDQSAVLLGAAAAIRSQAGTPSRLDERHLSMCRILRTELGEDAFDALWAEGAAMAHDEAAELALSLD